MKQLTVTQTIVSPCDTIYTLNKTLNKTDENRGLAATRTHESAPAHEGQPAAAAGQDFDSGQPDRGRQAASEERREAPQADSQDEASEELLVWLGQTLKARQGELVRSVGEVKRGQVKACLRTLKRWAKGDEGRVRAYLADELDRQEGRDAGERASNVGVLTRWLADRKAWERWQAAADDAGSLPGAMRPPMPRRQGSAFLYEASTAAWAATLKR